MHEKQTLHDYVYHHLREQIISGQRPYGTKLPSMSQLCEFYSCWHPYRPRCFKPFKK